MQVSPEATTLKPSLEITLDVGGMKCAGCVKAVENQLIQHPGVISATVNLVTEVAKVDCEPDVDPVSLANRLSEAGFPTHPREVNGVSAGPQETPAEPVDLVAQQRQETRQHLKRVAIAALLLILSTMGHLDHFGWATVPLLSNIWVHFALATLVLIGPGRPILIDGWRGLWHRIPNMNTLVGLGTLTAYTTSVIALLFPRLGWECFFDEPVMLLGFILLGRALEQQARGRAANAFQSLIALKPTLARLITKDDRPFSSTVGESSTLPHVSSSVQVPVEQVQVGSWLQVLPGEKIPVDGEVIAGQTTINEAMLTGEAMPVLKQPGDEVIAGSINQSGAIAIRATRTGKNTTLAQIIALVEAAQTRKAPIQGLADTVAGYFTYGVMLLASLTFLFWYFIGIPLWHEAIASTGHLASEMGQMAHHLTSDHSLPAASPLLLSLKLAIAVLVIACPCALGLATPTAILVGSGLGAEHGLLIRGGDVLEKVHRLQTVVFDKTGTLTSGKPAVTDCLSLSEDISETELLQYAATVESGARHPLAEAIQTHAEQQSVALLPAQNFLTEPGLGVSAEVLGQTVFLGNHLWLAQNGIEMDGSAHAKAQNLLVAGKTVVYVAIDGRLAGLIAAQDTIRPDAKATLEQLRRMGLRVVLLTGDQRTAAEAIARSLDLAPSDVLAGVRPEGKAEAVAHLQAQGHRVAMVGDGINDAPALAQADVGISLHSGTDVAIETSEIVLMRDRLSDVVNSIRLSRATFNKIRQNLFWAFAYNTLGIPIAAGVLLPSMGIIFSPATAGAFMAFSSVIVVTNSLLLRQTRFWPDL